MSAGEIERMLCRAAFVHRDLTTADCGLEIERWLAGRRDLIPIVALSPWAAIRFAAADVAVPDAVDLCWIAKALARLHWSSECRSSSENRGAGGGEQFLDGVVREFFLDLRADGVSSGDAIRRQAPYLGTGVSLNPRRSVRHFAVAAGETCIAVRYGDAEEAAQVLANRTSFERALGQAAHAAVRPAPLLAVVPDGAGVWMVTRYCGMTLSDMRGRLDVVDLSTRFARLLDLLHERAVVWSDFNPRNVVTDEEDSLWAVDFERFCGPGAGWQECDYERIFLTWQPLLGELALKCALAGRYDPETLDVWDCRPLSPDNWDFEWLRQERLDHRHEIPFTRGLKRRLMQLSFKIETSHNVGDDVIDVHTMCCHITDHAGTAIGVLAHRLIGDAWHRNCDSFAKIVARLSAAVRRHRRLSAFRFEQRTDVLQDAVMAILAERRDGSARPLETVRHLVLGELPSRAAPEEEKVDR